MGEGTSPCVYWGEGNLGDGPGLLLHPNPSTINVYSECSKKTTERLTMCHPPLLHDMFPAACRAVGFPLLAP